MFFLLPFVVKGPISSGYCEKLFTVLFFKNKILFCLHSSWDDKLRIVIVIVLIFLMFVIQYYLLICAHRESKCFFVPCRFQFALKPYEVVTATSDRGDVIIISMFLKLAYVQKMSVFDRNVKGSCFDLRFSAFLWTHKCLMFTAFVMPREETNYIIFDVGSFCVADFCAMLGNILMQYF